MLPYMPGNYKSGGKIDSSWEGFNLPLLASNTEEENREPGNAGSFHKQEKGEELDSPQEPPEGPEPCWPRDVSPLRSVLAIWPSKL